ncbi:C-type lectin domain family 10 member A-like isoform X1 [Acanthopagrus latus]|uniref:C-type lectin domain family 10 member A-like isoform X1 n=1 Tax=Acanthopagrus latus TaxID=8177 RepID=UPI00187CFD73|nr:C-type lectin domain family 10 member A-like isoform X1 [Acanthopagrus latus]
MEEEEVNYASVVFKANKNPTAEAKNTEETVYDQVKVKNQPTEQTVDTKADEKANKRDGHFRQLACCVGILCVVLLLAIIGVCVYITTLNYTSEQNQLRDNLTILQAVNFNLTNINDKLNSAVNNLTVQLDNLNKSYADLESNNTDVIAENQKLKTQNQQLETQNQQLETKMKTLNETLQETETERNELNVSRAQWSIDQYCPIKGAVRQCKSCQAGWRHDESRCYVIIDERPPEQKTWAGAQAVCKEKISDLAVINNATEKQYISGISWNRPGISGYWIGLRVVDGKWTWVDGSNLTDISWIQPATPTEGHCAISVTDNIPNNGLKSVSCSEMNAWICEKKALSLTPP